ncbi:uncharacterized protein [Euphorbia lathyris]|uniref:uncharacterized protein isoform X2 n=1 Tax=Euphorbia lathyris TaxID=212925 RepID=UPI003313B03C
MIFRSIAIIVPCRPLLRPICAASNDNPHQLRLQLDQLHSEAEDTRAKANSARLRLMRLSEAAEKLKRQAAISVNSRKENEARELLFQKKKVMEAMERSKSRIELFDELAAKLNEVISLKESQLIGNIDLDLEAVSKDGSGPVRIMSPTLGVITDGDEDSDYANSLKDTVAVIDEGKECEDWSNSLNDGINKELQFYADGEANILVNKELGSHSEVVSDERSIVADLNEKPNNSKVQQTTELLESICAIRQRIGRIMHKV